MKNRCFISYKRERANDITILAMALRDVGVPVWQDVNNLRHGPTQTELRRVLASDEISSAVLYITPELAASPVVLGLEGPELVRRAGKNRSFSLIPVAAGGLDYGQAAKLFEGQSLGGYDLSQWNMLKVNSDPLSADDARTIAKGVLRERLRAIGENMPAQAPLAIHLYDSRPTAHDATRALTVDWSAHMKGRHVAEGAMEGAILPAIATLAATIEATPGLIRHPLHMSGNLYLPTALALGAEFRAMRRFQLVWRQYTPGVGESDWGLHVPPDDHEAMTAQIIEGTPGARDLAVLVAVNDDPMNDFERTRPSLPPMGTLLHIGVPTPDGGMQPIRRWSPGQARHAVDTIVDAIRRVRTTRNADGTVHLFMAAPTGLAVMLGQSLNTLGKVTAYQYDKDAPLPYHPAVTLRSSH